MYGVRPVRWALSPCCVAERSSAGARLPLLSRAIMSEMAVHHHKPRAASPNLGTTPRFSECSPPDAR